MLRQAAAGQRISGRRPPQIAVIVKLVSNPKFAAMMQEKISMKVDTFSIEQEIAAHEKQLRQS